MAGRILVNAKTAAALVCNAAESLVLHAEVAAAFLARIDASMADVELVGDERYPGAAGPHRRGDRARTSPPSSWT